MTVDVHELVVLRQEYVTPRMVRLVLGGPGLAGLESRTPDDHVKLVFPDSDTGRVRLPVRSADGLSLEWPRPFPETREYTIRRLTADECWIDFVVHEGGLASGWAVAAAPGATLAVAGPRAGEVVPGTFTHHVLLGDHTALPAIGRWLEDLPDGVRASVAVLVPDRAEEQDLLVRDGVDLTWFHEDDPAVPSSVLADFAAGVDRTDGRPVYLWAAGEAALLKPVRVWARSNGFARGTCDIAGYWRRPRTRSL
ncbi:Siderophore-interacting FAD-binding domain protein [Aeromicrobium marinum DSM 15272]|uniref:Siderophore-interacting FAD-binding domain protein n=1 Tax=Aeromicrobium marinum DSM 15272 TaxID=585531 RepID=E2SCL8_9ACTN|nr:siderophore-interacting protein [Aeromicrobium marinum]EFQ82971.1 Siderophore-interacting FAD-binding domain protein [Aeromicrobium marinum DSM 15272]